MNEVLPGALVEDGYVIEPCWKIGENLAWSAGPFGTTDSIFRAW